MKTLRGLVAAGMAVGFIGAGATTASAVQVDVELQLLIDSSGSISSTEFTDQVGGYAAAFNDPTIQALVTDSTGGRVGQIAVQAIFWSGSTQQTILQSDGTLGATNHWFLLDDAASSSNFANQINGVSQPFIGQTGIAGAINFGRGLFAGNIYDGSRLVMDVSGDGRDNQDCSSGDTICTSVQNARNAALNTDGIDRINGLAITADVATLGDYYADNVIGGPGAFVLAAGNFSTEFTSAIRDKLAFEISGGTPDGAIPLPAAGWMMIAGMGGLAALRRRRRAA